MVSALSIRASSFALATSLLAATTASAQGLGDDFWIEAGVFFPQIDSDITVSSKNIDILGTKIDIESDLGLESSSQLLSVLAGARLTNNLAIEANYYRIGREGTIGLSREIVFDDVTYPVSASLTSNLSSDIYRLTLNYSFLRNESVELGVSAGAHVTNFSVQLAGEGSIGDQTADFRTRRRKITAPLPTAGLFALVEVVPNVTLRARAEYLSLKLGGKKGQLTNAQISAAYRASRNVEIGFGYRFVDYRLEIDKPDWFGRYDYRFFGPSLFLQVGF